MTTRHFYAVTATMADKETNTESQGRRDAGEEMTVAAFLLRLCALATLR